MSELPTLPSEPEPTPYPTFLHNSCLPVGLILAKTLNFILVVSSQNIRN